MLKKKFFFNYFSLSKFCARYGARTHDPQIESHRLYWQSQSDAPIVIKEVEFIVEALQQRKLQAQWLHWPVLRNKEETIPIQHGVFQKMKGKEHFLMHLINFTVSITMILLSEKDITWIEKNRQRVFLTSVEIFHRTWADQIQ